MGSPDVKLVTRNAGVTSTVASSWRAIWQHATAMFTHCDSTILSPVGHDGNLYRLCYIPCNTVMFDHHISHDHFLRRDLNSP